MSSGRHVDKILVIRAGNSRQVSNSSRGTKVLSRNKEMKAIVETVPQSRIRLDGQTAAHCREARMMGIRPR